MMGFGYYLCKMAGIDDFAFNLHHLPQTVRSAVENDLPDLEKFHFMDETAKLLGSGGALWNAKDFLQSYPGFLIANGDEVLIPEDKQILKTFLHDFENTKPLAQLLVMDHPELLKTLKPVWINDKNEVIAFGMDRPTQPCRPVHYTGYKIFSKEIFNWLPEGESNIFYEVLTAAIAAGETVKVMEFKNLQWFETGTIPKYFEATEACLRMLSEEQDYLQDLFEFYGSSAKDFEIQVQDDAILCFPKGWQEPASLECKGVVVIGKNVNLGDSVSLENVVVESGVTIPPNSRIQNQILFQD